MSADNTAAVQEEVAAVTDTQTFEDAYKDMPGSVEDQAAVEQESSTEETGSSEESDEQVTQDAAPEETKADESEGETESDIRDEAQTHGYELPELPEGVSVLEPALLDSLLGIAKESDVPQETISAAMEKLMGSVSASAEAQQKLIQSQRQEKLELLRADPIVGGAKLKENIASIKTSIHEQFSENPDAGKVVVSELDRMGLLVEPDFVRWLVPLVSRSHSAMAEGASALPSKDPVDSFYGATTPKGTGF